VKALNTDSRGDEEVQLENRDLVEEVIHDSTKGALLEETRACITLCCCSYSVTGLSLKLCIASHDGRFVCLGRADAAVPMQGR
jgi:hypothetical protein